MMTDYTFPSNGNMVYDNLGESFRIPANTIVFQKYWLRIHEIQRPDIGTFVTTHANIFGMENQKRTTKRVTKNAVLKMWKK